MEVIDPTIKIGEELELYESVAENANIAISLPVFCAARLMPKKVETYDMDKFLQIHPFRHLIHSPSIT